MKLDLIFYQNNAHAFAFMEVHLKRLTAQFFLIVLVCCAAIPAMAQDERKEEKYVANFKYTPPKQNTPTVKTNVTFAIANVIYKNSNNGKFTSEQFSKLPGALQQDIARILEAKGFGVRGPYESYDLIPYQDKKGVDFLLVPYIELSVEAKDIKEDLESFWAWQSPTLQTGNAVVTGKLTIELREIFTRELMWVKNIPFKDTTTPFTIVVPWEAAQHEVKRPYAYDPILNVSAKALEENYPDIMATFYNLVDPEEMAVIKKQAQELRSKKGY